MRFRLISGLTVLTLSSLVVGLLASAAGALAGQDAYFLAPGDAIEILVLGDDDLSRTVTIKPDGTIDLPLVGEVKAVGITTSQLTADLVQRYSKYLKAPRITVVVRQFRVNRISILGQVNRPGEYELRPGQRVADLLAAAGGVTGHAALQRAFITRGTEQIPVDVHKILAGDLEANMPLRAGDMMVVPESQDRIAVLGAVNKPGAYDRVDGMKLIDAIALAGGQSEGANLSEVAIVRLEGNRTKTIAADLGRTLSGQDMSQNIPLQQGDVVYVSGRGATLERAGQFLGVLNLIRFLFSGGTFVGF